MRRRVEAARVASLGTVSGSGRPHLVPCCFTLRASAVYTAVDGKPKSTLRLKRLANIRSNPRVSLLVHHYEEDWSLLWWIRMDGSARILEAGREREDALALLTDKYDHYLQRPPPGPVIALDVDGWTGWP